MPGDYFTVADVKGYLEITGTQNDALLSKMVTRGSRWIDNYTQHPLGFDHEVIANENLRGHIDNDGNLIFAVKKATANSISALSWGTTPQNLTALDASLCWADWGETTGYVVRWLGGGLLAYRNKLIIVRVSYDGGYTTLPEELVEAGITTTARVFKARQAGYADAVGSADVGMQFYGKVATANALSSLKNFQRKAPW